MSPAKLVCAMISCVLLSSPLVAQSPEARIDDIADAYLAAYQAFDIDRIEALVTEDFDFSDPTSESLPNPFNYSGRDVVMGHWRDYRAGVDSHRFVYTIDRRYAFSGHVVLIGSIEVFATGQGMSSHAEASIVTILTVRDGQVAAHRDYADYESFFENWARAPLDSEFGSEE